MAIVPLTIPAAHNAGWTKVYKLKVGRRGGKSWTCIQTVPVAGAHFPIATFEEGEYKLTQWVNGWPCIIEHFRVNADDTVTDLFGL